jgi:hypothetical protein
MNPAVAASDRLLDSLGSATPLNPNDWKLVKLLLAWRNEVEREPMPKWVA